MADFPFLFAIGWLEIVIFIVVFIIPLISQMFGGGDEAKEARRKRQQPRRQPPQEPLHDAPQQGRAPQQGARPQGGGRSALESEIEEFLSRAQGSKRRQQPEKKVQPQFEEPAAKPRTLVPPRADSGAQTAPRERELGRGVADHVRDHIQSAPISEHAKQLGRDVGQSDEKLEDHIHDVFDHQLGKLNKQETEEPPTQGTDSEVWESSVERRERSDAVQRGRVEDIAKMIRDPVSMQQAVILSEILRRPE